MKHIFTVHSPITALAALVIIQKLQLPPDNVVIVNLHKSESLLHEYNQHSFDTEDKTWWQKLSHINLPKKYDSFIDKIIGGKQFHAYIDLMHLYQRILVTHANCEGFSFFEEGSAAYVIPDNLNLLTSPFRKYNYRNKSLKEVIQQLMLTLRGYSMRLVNLPYQPLSYSYTAKNFFCFSQHAYMGVDSVKKVVLNFSDVQFHEQVEGYNNAIIIVEETFPYTYKIDLKKAYHVIKKNFETIIDTQGEKKIFLKTRGAKKLLSEKILDDLNCSYTRIDNQHPLEISFTKSEETIVVGCVSSLLMYAKIAGLQIASYYPELRTPDTRLFDGIWYLNNNT